MPNGHQWHRDSRYSRSAGNGDNYTPPPWLGAPGVPTPGVPVDRLEAIGGPAFPNTPTPSGDGCVVDDAADILKGLDCWDLEDPRWDVVDQTGWH